MYFIILVNVTADGVPGDYDIGCELLNLTHLTIDQKSSQSFTNIGACIDHILDVGLEMLTRSITIHIPEIK